MFCIWRTWQHTFLAQTQKSYLSTSKTTTWTAAHLFSFAEPWRPLCQLHWFFNGSKQDLIPGRSGWGQGEVSGIKAAPGFTFLLHHPPTVLACFKWYIVIRGPRWMMDALFFFFPPDSRNVTRLPSDSAGWHLWFSFPWNVSTTVWLTSLKFATHIHVPPQDEL